MKKKINITAIILIFVLLVGSFNQTYAKIYKRQNKNLVDISSNSGDGDTEATAEAELKEYGYEGNIQDEMVWDAKITVYVDSDAYKDTNSNTSKEYWNVKIGNKQVESKVKFTEIQRKYACEEQEPTQVNENTKFEYDSVLIAERTTGSTNSGIKIELREVYTGSDMAIGRNSQNTSSNTSQNSNTGTNNSNSNNTKSKSKGKTSIIEKIAGPIVMIVLDAVRAVLDFFQMLCNMLVTSQYNTGINQIFPWRITYTYDDILSDPNKNQYVNVSKGAETYSEDDTRKILDPIDGDKLGFDADTEIPIIPVDFYNLGYGNIGFLDINFFKVNTNIHQSDSFWMKIRNIFAILMHVLIFLAAALLLSILIIRGIKIVWGSLTPTEKKEQKEGLNDFLVAFVMLIGSIAIMILLIYFNNIFFKDTSLSEFPLRVSVEGTADYNFSANIAGYARYMTQINKVDEIKTKAAYVGLYLLVVSVNLYVTALMIFRLFYIMFLSLIVPIKSVGYAIGKKELFGMTYGQWVFNYAKGVAIQLVISLCYILISKFAVIVTG